MHFPSLTFYPQPARWVRLAGVAALALCANAAKSHAQSDAYAASYQAAYRQQISAAPQQPVVAVARVVPRAQAWNPQSAPSPAPAPAVRSGYSQPSTSLYLRFDGRYATAPYAAPLAVQNAVGAANTLQNKPYRMGGGHAQIDDRAYDCSGAVSYVLVKSGLLRSPMSSAAFASYGRPGPGRFITIYVKPGEHVFMTICGLRLDTTGGADREGPRWRGKLRSADGFIMRHPPGF